MALLLKDASHGICLVVFISIFLLIFSLFTLEDRSSADKESSTNNFNRQLLAYNFQQPNESVQNNSWTTNCSVPAIDNFPQVLKKYRQPAMMIVYSLLAFYMFVAIAIVCDDFFVPSLDVICQSLKLQSDVAGSTFMAAGSSAPELAASVIGVFIAKDDIGLSAVLGSAVFNILFIIGLCGLFAGQVTPLNWWPVTRDCFFYLISIVVLFYTLFDETVTWKESTILLVIYLIYIIFMVFNQKIEFKVNQLCSNLQRLPKQEFDGVLRYKQIEEQKKHTDINYDSEDTEFSLYKIEDLIINSKSETSLKSKLWSAFIFPIRLVLLLTIPDCRKEDIRKWFFLTFAMSCIWISVYSYILIWLITLIGFSLNISDNIMGLWFVAAGISIPDALASLIVVRDGLGDMAVTNAIASNVFDILVCLGLPWFIKTALLEPGSTVKVISKGLEYTTISLLSTIVFFLFFTHINGWKLTKKYGLTLLIWYFVFMVLATFYELNLFGKFSSLVCS